MSRALQSLISRYPQDRVVSELYPHCLLAKVDISAYEDPAIRKEADGSVSMLCGEPLIVRSNSDVAGTRQEDLAEIHAACERVAWDTLVNAQGVFCAAHYSPKTLQLTLISDKLCIRPLYYWIGDQYVVFATALRILEGLSFVPKEVDVRAIAEITTLGIPLGHRTAYKDIALMEAGQIIQLSPQQLYCKKYWRWDDVKSSALDTSSLLREAATRFRRAVIRRNRDDKRTLAFLSGGLDSRGVVATLRSLDVEVHTFNLAATGTLDQVLAAQFAEVVGTFHQDIALDWDADAKFSTTLARAWGGASARQEKPVPRPRLVWSGDGGSVGVGHVYLTKENVDRLRAGNLDGAIDEYLCRAGARVLVRLFASELVGQLADFPFKGVKEELLALHAEDPGRNFHLFLMLNDQRRHLAEHFEHIDLHRLELQLPYFDSDFVELMVSSPIDFCLRHGFYNQWLHYMPADMLRVPWQAYPGHEPCPLSMPESLIYQWDADAFASKRGWDRKRRLLEAAAQLLEAADFPHNLIRKPYLRLAMWAYWLGLRNTSHVLQTARTVYRYAHLCRNVDS